MALRRIQAFLLRDEVSDNDQPVKLEGTSTLVGRRGCVACGWLAPPLHAAMRNWMFVRRQPSLGRACRAVAICVPTLRHRPMSEMCMLPLASSCTAGWVPARPLVLCRTCVLWCVCVCATAADVSAMQRRLCSHKTDATVPDHHLPSAAEAAAAAVLFRMASFQFSEAPSAGPTGAAGKPAAGRGAAGSGTSTSGDATAVAASPQPGPSPFTGLHDVTLSVAPGELVAVVGVVGACTRA